MCILNKYAYVHRLQLCAHSSYQTMCHFCRRIYLRCVDLSEKLSEFVIWMEKRVRKKMHQLLSLSHSLCLAVHLRMAVFIIIICIYCIKWIKSFKNRKMLSIVMHYISIEFQNNRTKNVNICGCIVKWKKDHL